MSGQPTGLVGFVVFFKFIDAFVSYSQVDILAGRHELLPSSVASYHGLAMAVVIICCQGLYHKEQWMVVVAEANLLNHRRRTSRNRQASRCCHCCTSQMTEVDGQSSQQMHLSECPNDA